MNQNECDAHPRQTAGQRDTASPVWDMSQERAFIENLLSQRFNFFLVFFSLVIAGAVNVKTPNQLPIILGIGSTVSVLLAMVLARSQEKLDIILGDLFTDMTHPATIADKRAKQGGSRRRLIGIWIPRLCCGFLILGFVLALFGILRVPAGSAPRVAHTSRSI